MKDLDFPLYITKSSGGESFELTDPAERKKYFEAKAGKKIDELREYLQKNTFIAYLLGKKQAGKGTYTKLLAEALEIDTIRHLSVGDLVRSLEIIKTDEKEKQELYNYLSQNYRGYISLDEAFEAFANRSTATLMPTEFILAIVKREIEKAGKVSLCIDGFPRNLDQISYALYFRELIGYRSDPDIFVLIDVPEAVIDERIKARRACPKCGLSRNITLFPTSIVEYDTKKKEFYLMCDNKECTPTRMEAKEGDEKGVEHIRSRLEMDDELIRKAFKLHGVPKILIRSSIPVEMVDEIADTYELTKRSTFSWDNSSKQVTKKEELWQYTDDNGVESYTLTPPPVIVAMIDNLHQILIEGKR